MNVRQLCRCLAQYSSIKRAVSASRTQQSLLFQQKRYANGYGAGPQLPGQVAPQPGQPEEQTSEKDAGGRQDQSSEWNPTLFKMFESAATTMVSLFVLGYSQSFKAMGLHD